MSCVICVDGYMELIFWQLAEKIWQLVYFDSWYQLDTVGVKFV